MNILIINNGTKHLGRLKDLLLNHKIQMINFLDKTPDLRNIDLVILTGNSIFPLFYNQDIYKEEISLINNSNKPIVGICFGCELIAYTFGAKIERVENKIKGIKRIEILNRDSVFKGVHELEVYESHHWVITTLSKDLIGLAKSKYGYEVIKHKEKQIYGFQFHPEMLVDKTAGDEIFNNLISSINKAYE